MPVEKLTYAPLGDCRYGVGAKSPGVRLLSFAPVDWIGAFLPKLRIRLPAMGGCKSSVHGIREAFQKGTESVPKWYAREGNGSPRRALLLPMSAL